MVGSAADFSALNEIGLNRQAVLGYESLPQVLRRQIEDSFCCHHPRRQLIVIGNGGPLLWRTIQVCGWNSAEPIDDFSTSAVADWFASHYPQHSCTQLFPAVSQIGLQQLGELAGWHQAAPFMLGIDPFWGSWFAYRVVLLTDTEFALTPRLEQRSPCLDCSERPCVAACPPRAMSGQGFSMRACADYRLASDSACRYRCLARDACPVGSGQRYDDAQLRHGYGHSLAALKTYMRGSTELKGSDRAD